MSAAGGVVALLLRRLDLAASCGQLVAHGLLDDAAGGSGPRGHRFLDRRGCAASARGEALGLVRGERGGCVVGDVGEGLLRRGRLGPVPGGDDGGAAGGTGLPAQTANTLRLNWFT